MNRTPPTLKAIAGTQRPDRVYETVDFEPCADVPRAPDWLANVHAVAEWNRLGPILHANGLLTEAGLTAFGVMCSLFGKIVQLYAAGESPTANMITGYRSLANDFGLTPYAQGRVKGSFTGHMAERPGNKFANNGKRA